VQLIEIDYLRADGSFVCCFDCLSGADFGRRLVGCIDPG
jgi:hypothetical protein